MPKATVVSDLAVKHTEGRVATTQASRIRKPLSSTAYQVADYMAYTHYRECMMHLKARCCYEMQTLALQHVVAIRNSKGHELFDTRSGATYTFAAYSDF
jgi:hypothetical protein